MAPYRIFKNSDSLIFGLARFFSKRLSHQLNRKRGLKERKGMDRKDLLWFTSKEISLNQKPDHNSVKPEFEPCEEIRDCLRYSKQLAEGGERKGGIEQAEYDCSNH